MVRDDVPESVRTQVTKSLLELTQTSQGKTILAGMETSASMPPMMPVMTS